MLAGCTLYHPAPLATTPHYATLKTIDSRALQAFPTIKAHPFNAADGLDTVEIEMLAVSHNPALRLARSDLSVTEAQSFAAGLLPDPQLSLAHDITHPSDVGAASSYGISYDFGALLAHSSAKKSATEANHQATLNLLWQEWQVIGQAQLLMVRARMQRDILRVLERQQHLLADRSARSDRAMQQGILSRDSANSDRVAVQAIDTKIDDQKALQATTLHDLNDLLGLPADTQLDLQLEPSFAPSTHHQTDLASALPAPELIQVALAQMAERRPDLQALQAGYASQDAKFRQAILAQFPSLNVGLTQATDAAGVVSNSLGISLSLPIFNRNRGTIAIEQATRQRMQDEYQMRLNQTESSVIRLQSEQQQQFAVWQNRQSTLRHLREDVDHARSVASTGLLDDVIWMNLNTNLLNQELELLSLEQSIREQDVGLSILLGLPTEHRNSTAQGLTP